MERRTALALALAAAGTVLAASAAFATNVGLLGQGAEPPVGVLDASSVGTTVPADPTVVTIIVEDPSVPVAAGPSAMPAAAVRVSSSGDDRGGDDDSFDDSDFDDDRDDDRDDEDDDDRGDDDDD